MALQIRLWLAHQPDVGNVLKLTGLELSFSLKMMGLTEQKEVLLKLEDGDKPAGPALTETGAGVNGSWNQKCCIGLPMANPIETLRKS